MSNEDAIVGFIGTKGDAKKSNNYVEERENGKNYNLL